MKTFISLTVSLLLWSAISATAAPQVKCTGDAARLTPPVVNHPTHVRNIVWRNTRAICQQQPKERGKATVPSNLKPQPASKNNVQQ